LQLRWDQEADALYITLAEAEVVSRTIEIDNGTLVDVDRFGHAVGIEVLNPARSWPFEAILEQFGIANPDAESLRRLFGTDAPDRRYPFAPDERAAVA
jgi:uncharacterized protein YuzE